MTQKKLGSKGQKQAGVVMREFESGKLRSRSGKKVTDPEQAKAIAMSEGRQAQKKGVAQRTWQGRTRMRPKK